MNANEVLSALRARYAAPSWAFFEEVFYEVGGGRIDALAMACWRSRGLELHGFEVKVSRRDWLREMKNPAKSEPGFKFCDRFWLVAAPGVAEPEETPKGWGFLLVNGGKCRVVVPGPTLKPKPVSREFLAAILRRQFEAEVGNSRSALFAEYTRGYESGKASAVFDGSTAAAELKKLSESLILFEKSSGVKISSYNGGDIGEAVGLLRRREDAIERARRDLDFLKKTAARVAATIEEEIKARRP